MSENDVSPVAAGVDRVDRDAVRRLFQEVYGADTGEEARAFQSPGRVNLIGDHIDYSGGCVLPMALDRGTYCVVRPNHDGVVRGVSVNYSQDGVIEVSLSDTSRRDDMGWFAYVAGVIHELDAGGTPLSTGLDIALAGDIPDGSGLSSSSSLELGVAVAANTIGELGLDATELALVGQRAENNYIGVATGIMDQLTIARGRAGSALLMDCAQLSVEYVPFPHDRASVIIADTKQRRSLDGSAYNERRTSVETAAFLLERTSVIDLPEAELDVAAARLDDPDMLARVRHTVTEQARVLEAAVALKSGDMARFGTLMKLSHESLRDDFEVTGPALDALAEAAWAQPGCIGARMTGAGFGGCVVILAEPGREDEVVRGTRAGYRSVTGVTADFLMVSSDDGAREVGL